MIKFNTVEVVHLADFKFGNFGKKRDWQALSVADWPRIPKKYFHGTFLKNSIGGDCQLKKKLPNHQVEITIKCTTYIYGIL